MYSNILFFLLVPLALFFLTIILVFLWDKISPKAKILEPGNGQPEGAFRAFYHALWILLLWSGLALSLPLWFSYKQKISGLAIDDRLIIIGKILVFPLILLVLLRYGARQGYLKWIDGLEWPDKENR